MACTCDFACDAKESDWVKCVQPISSYVSDIDADHHLAHPSPKSVGTDDLCSVLMDGQDQEESDENVGKISGVRDTHEGSDYGEKRSIMQDKGSMDSASGGVKSRRQVSQVRLFRLSGEMKQEKTKLVTKERKMRWEAAESARRTFWAKLIPNFSMPLPLGGRQSPIYNRTRTTGQ